MVFAVVHDVTEVERLVEELLSLRRLRPHCVVTTRAGSDVPAFDAAGLAADCADLADVTVVPTGPLTWRLSERLPDLCGVYGGASRVYPIGSGWQSAPLLSPLRFIYSPADAAHARERLLEDALTMAAAATGFGRSQTPGAAPKVRARVEGFVAGGSRALVRTDTDTIATISADLAVPGIPLDWFLEDGALVEGRLQGIGLFQVALTALDERSALAHFEVGAVTVALVKSVARQEAQLLLHPDLAVRVTRQEISSNPRDIVTRLLSVGEVLPVRIVRTAQGRLGLRLDDIEDDEDVQAALPLVDGGPPWLVAGRDLDTAAADTEDSPADTEAVEQPEPASSPPVEEAPSPLRPAPGPGVRPAARATGTPVQPRNLVQQLQGQVELLKRENLRLRGFETEAGNAAAMRLELGQEHARLADVQAQLQREKRVTSELRRAARAGVSQTRSPLESRDRFDSADQWLRHEIYLTWVDRLPAGDRRQSPIFDGWTIGPDFAATVGDLTDSTLRKVLRAVVDVVTGRAGDLDGRELHQLRQGLGGDDPLVVRPRDGAVCWRVAIERNTPSARRLHFWRTPTGVELSRVVLHDDYQP